MAPPRDVDSPALTDVEPGPKLERMAESTFDLAAGVGAPGEVAAPSRYTVLGSLGEGGMGLVYTAYDRTLDRKVALKLLRREESAAARARLTREAQALAKLHHPNVVTVFDAGSVGERPYIAMELVEGSSLRSWLEAGPRPWREVLRVFLAAGRGLAAAHAHGLVHRDFKPDNVLVGGDGRVRVADFGLARRAQGVEAALDPHGEEGASGAPESGDLTAAGAILGTPRYMAPEQHLGQPADARSDQFAFCVALHEALYQASPFGGAAQLSELAELRERVLAGRVAEPQRGAVPSRLWPLVRRGLAAAPDERWPTMDALLDELARDPGQAWRRRLAVAGIAVAVAALAVPVTLRLSRRDDVCGGAALRLAGVWDGAVASRARAAFLASGRPHAAETFRRVAAHLDARAAAWVAMRTDACEATARRHEQSEQVRDRRMRCLDRVAVDTGAVTAIFAAGGADTVDRALQAVARLPDTASCTGAERLAAIHPLPADPEARRKIAAAEAELARASALMAVGQRPQALAAVAGAMTLARASGDVPTMARAALDLGTAQTGAKRDEAEATLREATRLAAQIGDDDLGARAWFGLVELLEKTKRAAEAEALLFALDTAAARPGAAPVRAAQARYLRANVLRDLGRFDEAYRIAAEAVTLFEKDHRPGDSALRIALTFRGSTAISMGRREEAIAMYRRALATAVEESGPEHPVVATLDSNLAGQLVDAGEPAQASDLLRGAITILEKTYGPDAGELADALHNLGYAERMADHFEEAEAAYRRAVDIRTRTGDVYDAARALQGLGLTFSDEGRLAEARAPLAQSLVTFEDKMGRDSQDVAEAATHLGAVELGLGDVAAAVAHLERGRDLMARLHPGGWQEAMAWRELGEARCAGGQLDAGLRDLEKSLAVYRGDEESDRQDMVTVATLLAECQQRAGRPGDAPLIEDALARPGIPLRPRLEARASMAAAHALWLGRERPGARALAAKARDLYRKSPRGVEKELAAVEAWLAAHGG